jgi:hypothetical protein
MMSLSGKRELVATLRPRYLKGSRSDKQRILDELVATVGYHRKYAIRVLNHEPPKRSKARRFIRRKYGTAVQFALQEVWRVANRIAAKRLVPNLKEFVEALERFGEINLEAKTRELLLEISPATADRLLRRARRAEGRYHGKSTTKPGTLLKHSIPVRTFADWQDTKPGFAEVDLVAHCGESTHGEYVHTLNSIDVATRWTEVVAIVNRSQFTVSAAVVTMRERLPFPLLGIDSDNGGEFINANLKRYCEQEKITFTRSRAYKKNDQAYVEQKNYTGVRQFVGYSRYEGQQACDHLSQLYAPLRLYVNYFQPVMVLIGKERVGAKVKKHYDRAKTPYQRVLDAVDVSDEIKHRLRKEYLTLNPAALMREIEACQEALWRLANKNTNE